MEADDINKFSEQELLDLRERVDLRLKELASRPAVRPGEAVELVALAVQDTTVRCRTLDAQHRVTLRPRRGLHQAVEGHILTVLPSRQWTYGRTACVSGEIHDSRLDIKALGLVPLKLCDEWVWDPAEEYWGEPGEQPDKCFEPIIEAGPRPSYEMEQILPGYDPQDPDSDPIGQAVDLYEAGNGQGSVRILHRCLGADLRVLDAHAHLGTWAFRHGESAVSIERAAQHYEVGAAIGELSLGTGFKGVLEWGRINNRPYLRCLSGLGLCRWALGDHERAATIFQKMLWLNPCDNQGARFCLWDVKHGKTYAGRSREKSLCRSVN